MKNISLSATKRPTFRFLSAKPAGLTAHSTKHHTSHQSNVNSLSSASGMIVILAVENSEPRRPPMGMLRVTLKLSSSSYSESSIITTRQDFSTSPLSKRRMLWWSSGLEM